MQVSTSNTCYSYFISVLSIHPFRDVRILLHAVGCADSHSFLILWIRSQPIGSYTDIKWAKAETNSRCTVRTHTHKTSNLLENGQFPAAVSAASVNLITFPPSVSCWLCTTAAQDRITRITSSSRIIHIFFSVPSSRINRPSRSVPLCRSVTLFVPSIATKSNYTASLTPLSLSLTPTHFIPYANKRLNHPPFFIHKQIE